MLVALAHVIKMTFTIKQVQIGLSLIFQVQEFLEGLVCDVFGSSEEALIELGVLWWVLFDEFLDVEAGQFVLVLADVLLVGVEESCDGIEEALSDQLDTIWSQVLILRDVFCVD